jgi:putative drug exporter of the RND superfamily
VAIAIVVVTLILLVLFLRSLVAPFYLLAASVLAVFAALGLALLICRAVLGSASMVYFVPFAAGVLLVSLGSDYNVFVVGRIWEEARRRPVPDAVALAAPGASRAITTAGVALAASFAMLAVIPLEQFRQLAITMALGVILDAIAVRSLLVPALVVLFGRLGMWPGNRSLAVRDVRQDQHGRDDQRTRRQQPQQRGAGPGPSRGQHPGPGAEREQARADG